MKNYFLMLKTYIENFTRLIYPHICAGCGAQLTQKSESICFACVENLPYTNESIYKNSLLPKLQALQPIAGVYAMCYYNQDGILQELMKELKYRKQGQIGLQLGELLGSKLLTLSIDIDEIVPVPLHPKRESKRGYNQAKKIAEGVSEVLKIPINEALLLRTKHNESQTKRSKLNRFETVENSFAIKHPEQLQNKKLLLVDDVITTGATMLSCTAQLLENGAQKVYLAAIGKADALG